MIRIAVAGVFGFIAAFAAVLGFRAVRAVGGPDDVAPFFADESAAVDPLGRDPIAGRAPLPSVGRPLPRDEGSAFVRDPDQERGWEVVEASEAALAAAERAERERAEQDAFADADDDDDRGGVVDERERDERRSAFDDDDDRSAAERRREERAERRRERRARRREERRERRREERRERRREERERRRAERFDDFDDDDDRFGRSSDRDSFAEREPESRDPGFVTLDASPYGTVYIDGLRVGDTPLVAYRLPSGSHKVRVRSAAGDKSFTIFVPAGKTLRRRVIFE